MTTMNDLAARLNLTEARARALCAGDAPADDAETFAAPGLRHGFDGTRITGASSADAYDLGLRLSAQASRTPRRRLAHAPRWAWAEDRLVITRGTAKDTWVVNGKPVDTQAAHDAIAATVTGPVVVPPALVVDKRHTFTLLRAAIADLPAPAARVRAVLGWWEDASYHAGTGVFIPVLADLAEVYATARPDKENHAPWWAAHVLNRHGLTTHDATAALGEHLASLARVVPVMSESWLARFGARRRRADDGSLRDRLTPAQQHTTLRSMSEAADWHANWLTLTDPLAADAARWSGHVVDGTWLTSTASTWTLAIGESPCRYRPGGSVALLIPTATDDDKERTIHVDIEALSWDPVHGMCVTVSAFGKPNVAGALDRVCLPGASVVMQPVSVNASQAARAYLNASQRRSRADETSWLVNTSRAPQPRNVPWDVLINAASE